MTLNRTICAAVAVLALSAAGASAQSNEQNQPDPGSTPLDDLVVTTAPIRQQAEAFVTAIAAPPRGRKLAVWGRDICVGAIGMAPEPATVMVDRVLDWASTVGIRTRQPGCDPNVLIVSSDDANRTARDLVRARPRDFDSGASSSDRGGAALRRFQNSDRLVRWWHVSIPVDADTGHSLVRQRGQLPYVAPVVITKPSDLGDFGQIVSGSRLYDDSLDHMQSVVIIVDADALERADFNQLTDYVAMVALSQIDPDATPAAPSILNLFNPAMPQEAAMTVWDRAFLEALYGTSQRNVPGAADNDVIAHALARRVVRDAAPPPPQ